MQPASRNPALLAGAVVAVILIAAFVALTVQSNRTAANSGSLTLTVVPDDATITLDGNKTITTGTTSVAAGRHTITATRKDFTTKTSDFTITKGQETKLQLALPIADAAGRQYLLDHPDQEQILEAITGATIAQGSQITTQNNPLITILPYQGATFDIDIGLSRQHPNDPNAVGIYITADTPTDQAKAVGWIKAHGFNPTAYEIIYQTNAQADAQQ